MSLQAVLEKTNRDLKSHLSACHRPTQFVHLKEQQLRDDAAGLGLAGTVLQGKVAMMSGITPLGRTKVDGYSASGDQPGHRAPRKLIALLHSS
jgi:hypothetical protein